MIPFILIVVSVVVYFLLFYRSRKARLLSRLPGPPTLPIFGNALDLNVSNEMLLSMTIVSLTLRNGLDHFWMMSWPYVGFARAKYVEKVLASNTHIDKSNDYDFLMPWLGTGLLTSAGQKWSTRRKMLTPSFHFRILDDFLEVMNEQSTTMVKVLGGEFGQGQVFDVFPYITRCALDIICETAMGKKINAQRERDTDYVKAIYRISELIQHRQVRPWLHPNFLWQLSPSGKEEKKLLSILHGFTEAVIREKKTEFQVKRQKSQEEPSNKKKDDDDDVYMKGGKRRVAFLDLLLTAQAESKDPNSLLTDVDIREEVDTFMFRGHDTTAANANWTTFLLGCNPDYQAKVHEELDAIFGDDRDRPITNQDMSQMKYLECCIKESLRLYPSVPFIARAIKTDLQLDDKGTTIPAGTTAFIMPYQLHRDPEVFPEPEVFLPDRFFPENSVGRNPFAYVPFSAGPRNCIGQKFAMMEEKVMLANIFRNFRVEAAERREDLILLAELIMRPKHGLHIKLCPRP